jgi:ankyrin repeat protein
MAVAHLSNSGYTVSDSDYVETVVQGNGGIEDLNAESGGGFILWFPSARGILVPETMAETTVADRPRAHANETLPTAASLIEAAGAGDTAALQRFLKDGVKLDAPGANGDIPLVAASRNGHEDAVRLLLLAGANPNAASSNGLTPLYAAALEGHAAVVRLLLAGGANVDHPYSDPTPLDLASSRGDADVVQLLLAAGANVNPYPRDHPCPPLVGAAIHNHADVVRLLLASGARVDPHVMGQIESNMLVDDDVVQLCVARINSLRSEFQEQYVARRPRQWWHDNH